MDRTVSLEQFGLHVLTTPIDDEFSLYCLDTTELREKLSSGAIVVIKNAFSPRLLEELREFTVEWSNQTESYGFERSASLMHLNFHRKDSEADDASLPHCFHQFGFGNMDELEEGFRVLIRSIAGDMLTLQNLIAGTSFTFEEGDCRPKILRYPRGAGYLAAHKHPLTPQKIGLILQLSRHGTDYEDGGTVFETPFGKVSMKGAQDIGDLVLFRYDLVHEVPLVDVNASANWESSDGKWSMVLELLKTHENSNVD